MTRFLVFYFLLHFAGHVMMTSAEVLCTAEDMVYNCSGTGLTSVSNETKADDFLYETLDLSFNLFKKITQSDFPFQTKIVTLNLANNQISRIENMAFNNLESLVYLDLSNNHLSGNNLVEDAFFTMDKLRNLTLEKNPLQKIRKETFNFIELGSLRDLDLSHCDISVIEDDGIKLPTLVRLDLSWNRIAFVKEDMFKMMNELLVLDLSHNSIETLTEVPYFPKLKIWNLDSNKIREVKIRDAVPYMCDELEVLSLQNNKIMTFTPESLPWDQHLLNDKRVTILLTFNPIHCDCHMGWVADDQLIKNSNQTVRCEYPTNVRGMNLLTMQKSQLVCGMPLAWILIIVGCSIVGMLALGGFIFFFVSRRKNRRQRQTRKDKGNKYTAVYTKDESDANVSMKISDDQKLLATGEFEV